MNPPKVKIVSSNKNGDRTIRYKDGTSETISRDLISKDVSNKDLASAAKASMAAGVELNTSKLGRGVIQPTVSASEIANPPATVTPPVPTVNTNTGATTSNLVGNVATNTQGFIQAQSEEAAKAKEMATLLGTQEFNAADERQGLTDKFGVTGNLSRLTDIQTQLTNANTESGVTKTRIQGADGQTLGQAQREVTQEDRENAVRTAGLAAEAAVLQGSIETASTLINNAMTDFYSDRTLKNQNMIQQLEYFSGIADEQTKQLLGKEQRKYEEDQAIITRAQTAVDAAVTSGYATPEDLKKITSLAGDPASQTAYSQGIVANGARQAAAMERAKFAQSQQSLAISQQNADLNRRQAVYELAALGDPKAIEELGFDPNAKLTEDANKQIEK